MEIDIDELVDDIAKQADLDSYESDMLRFIEGLKYELEELKKMFREMEENK